MIDPALMRPGRFDKIVFVPNPDAPTRLKILQIHAKNKSLGPDVDLEKIATKTDRLSGAETSSVINTAVSIVLHEYLAKYPTPEEATKHVAEAQLVMRHFEEAVSKVKKQRDTRPEENVALSYYK